MKHTYSVRSWDNAHREYYLNSNNRYFVTIVDSVTKNRMPDFGRVLAEDNWLKLVIDGDDSFQIRDQLKKLLEWHKNVPDGEHIVIHCTMGMTRSPSMALAMMMADGLSAPDAFDLLNSQTPLDGCEDSEFELSSRIIECVDFHMNLNGDLVGEYYDRNF